jgi:putative autotransporter adhesin-like protein
MLSTTTADELHHVRGSPTGRPRRAVSAMSVASKPFASRGSRRRQTWAVAIIVVVAVGAAVWAVGHGSGPPVVTQQRSVEPFTSVQLAGSNLVSVRVGAPRSVAVHARTDMLDHVTTDVRAGTLVIADAPGHGNTKGPMGVLVTVPGLTSLSVAPGGSGLMDVGSISNQSLTVSLAGSGLVRATGTTAHLTVGLSGSGDVELGDVTSRDARVTVSGSGRAVVTATGTLNALVTGDGVIQYGGNPAQLATSVTGSGVIIPG